MCEPTLYIPTLKTCAILDDSLTPDGGVLVTATASNAMGVLPDTGAATGYVLTYDAAAAGDYKCAWKAAAGGGGGAPAYAVVQADAAVLGPDNDAVAVHLANLAPSGGGGYTATLTGAATDAGHAISVTLTGLPAGEKWTLTVSPAVHNAGGAITLELDAVGQGVRMMWTDLSTVAGAVSGWVLEHGGAAFALVP